MITRLFIALILIVGGVAILKYKNFIIQWTGYFDWAQKYLGSNGTSIVLALVGIGMIFLGFSYPFGRVSLESQQTTPQIQSQP